MDKNVCLKAAHTFHRSLEKMLERDMGVFKNEIEPNLKVCRGILRKEVRHYKKIIKGARSKWGPRKLEATSGIVAEIETMLARLNVKMDEFYLRYSAMEQNHQLVTISIRMPENTEALLPREILEWIIKMKNDKILKWYKTKNSTLGPSDFPKRVMEFRKECVDGLNLVKSVSWGFLTEEPTRENVL